MSSISGAKPTSPLDLLHKSAVNPLKQKPKKLPDQLAFNGPLSLAAKPKAGGAGETQDAAAKAKMAAEGLVSSTFIEPILKQMREANTAPPPFGPSSAEKQFSSLLDTKLADELVHASNFPLVERIADQLLSNMPRAPKDAGPALDIRG